jgi:hypothetical protein
MHLIKQQATASRQERPSLVPRTGIPRGCDPRPPGPRACLVTQVSRRCASSHICTATKAEAHLLLQRTLSAALTSALLSSSSRDASTCPLKADLKRAMFPNCGEVLIFRFPGVARALEQLKHSASVSAYASDQRVSRSDQALCLGRAGIARGCDPRPSAPRARLLTPISRRHASSHTYTATNCYSAPYLQR